MFEHGQIITGTEYPHNLLEAPSGGVLVGGVLVGGRRRRRGSAIAGSKTRRAPRKRGGATYMDYVKEYSKAHPGLSWLQAMKQAKSSYHQMMGPVAAGRKSGSKRAAPRKRRVGSAMAAGRPRKSGSKVSRPRRRAAGASKRAPRKRVGRPRKAAGSKVRRVRAPRRKAGVMAAGRRRVGRPRKVRA